MIIQPLHNYKREEKFQKVSKNDTHYRYVGHKYDVDILYHSSNFYYPDFFTLSVTDKSGKQVWDGSRLIIHGDFFILPFLSETYDAMVLPAVHDTSDSHSIQVMYLDLKTANCKPLADKGFYTFCGHFLSFNGLFYGGKDGIKCIDFDTQTEYFLHQKLSKTISAFTNWSTCLVPHGILVLTNDKTDNVRLVDIASATIKDVATLPLRVADKVTVSISPRWTEPTALLSVSYFTKKDTGVMRFEASEYFEVRL